ncbi:Abi family protein [Cryobacterium sp. 10I1]|uniref:Abi family protein n=1 Tax=unclassified Cryobacterium TaxID=2649013 RepID=UPI002AB48C88|nr:MULTISPECIES: Abi family protein [unclassified Cryobacterium]MDY7544527.1 Abi family protein [Cryobacterium sp. 5B3]MEB0000882.1 Abi family protein [Cryobacterium sp. RTS3]MEB0004778.1 Abi family protein [Cryobacterium sp. RTC2.1]MEB0203649.1 Abi family protein [Cryobacterium sp. 5I3]MEB0276247.1 Abi family protein [Cryobacterium sp. 5B3]
MAEYTKKWLSVDGQVAKLESRGVEVGDHESFRGLLRAVGYYRLTGYLYPFRESEPFRDDAGRIRFRVLNRYRSGTSVGQASALIDFDRRLRMLVLEGIERIEISFRMQIGYVLGRQSAFAHMDPVNFVNSFTESQTDKATGDTLPSRHAQWIERVKERQADSDEAFVAHFRNKYDDEMPIWALTEILELGHLGRLYSGLNSSLATEIAAAYGAPSKKVMVSWISSLNYVRNVSAHHARLFNRKLVSAPARPSHDQVPLLGHLKDGDSAKAVFGVYNALAVMAYLLRSIEPDSGWPARAVELLNSFPESGCVTIESMGVPDAWPTLELWRA